MQLISSPERNARKKKKKNRTLALGTLLPSISCYYLIYRREKKKRKKKREKIRLRRRNFCIRLLLYQLAQHTRMRFQHDLACHFILMLKCHVMHRLATGVGLSSVKRSFTLVLRVYEVLVWVDNLQSSLQNVKRRNKEVKPCRNRLDFV